MEAQLGFWNSYHIQQVIETKITPLYMCFVYQLQILADINWAIWWLSAIYIVDVLKRNNL